MGKRSLYLAYDGSINADWVARYGLRMARSLPERELMVVHVRDTALDQERLAAKLERLTAEGRALEVELSVLTPALKGDVVQTLLAAIPPGEEVYCLCGARVVSRGRGFLAGTVSQRLLRHRRFNTIALRVVNPGQLGCPANVLFPLSGHPRRFAAAMPLLVMLSGCVTTVTLLRIMAVHSLLYRYLSSARVKKLLHEGRVYIRAVMEDIVAVAGEDRFRLDDQVLVSDDWSKELLIQAGKARAGLLLLGASDRFLRSRFYYGSRIEQILRHAPCDVGIYRKI